MAFHAGAGKSNVHWRIIETTLQNNARNARGIKVTTHIAKHEGLTLETQGNSPGYSLLVYKITTSYPKECPTSFLDAEFSFNDQGLSRMLRVDRITDDDNLVHVRSFTWRGEREVKKFSCNIVGHVATDRRTSDWDFDCEERAGLPPTLFVVMPVDVRWHTRCLGLDPEVETRATFHYDTNTSHLQASGGIELKPLSNYSKES